MQQLKSRFSEAVAVQPCAAEQIAVYLSGRGVATAYGGVNGHLSVALRADPINHLSDIHTVLARQIESLQLQRCAARKQVNLVLAPELYNVSLIDRPDVDDAQLKDAVRWAIQEQVDYPVENATLDVFELPRSASRERPMVFVVSLKTELLKTLQSQVNSAGLQLASIDASELCLRNLTWQCFPHADQSIAMLRLTSNSGLVNISRGDELYLARRVSGLPDEFSEPGWAEFRERMVLQVQRSIDYYESAMNQPHCNMLVVACTQDWSERVTGYLTEMLPIPVRSIAEVLAGELTLQLHNPDVQHVDWQALQPAQANAIAAGLPALGGVLRQHIAQSVEQAA
ncbi:MAG: hypothetical protein ACFHXK_02825 [bacterium]